VEREFGIHEKCTVIDVVTKIYKKLVSVNIDRSNCNRCSLTERSVAFVITMRVTISFTCFTIPQLGKAKAHALVGTTTKQCL